MADKTPIANKNKDESLEPKSDNASLNSEIHATTKINSPVSPEDYPEEDRAAQVAAAGAPNQAPSKDD